MRIDNTRRGREERKKKDKKKKSILEDEIFAMMQNSLKLALDAAIDDILKEWK